MSDLSSISNPVVDLALHGFLSNERLIIPRYADGSATKPGPTAATNASLSAWTTGTGTPRMVPNRTGPSTLLQLAGSYVLVDCGSGSAYRLAELGIELTKIDAIFITHHHLDHNSDLAYLLIAPWICDQPTYVAPLIVGPPGTRELVARVFALHEYDIRVRLPQGFDPLKLVPEVLEVSDAGVVVRGPWQASAFRVDHFPVSQAFGYRFSLNGFSVAISGDTRPSENLIAACQDVDVLIHEAIFPGYGIPTYHTLSHEVGVVANKCRARHLVLTHLLPGEIPDEKWLDDARLGFDGPIDVAHDLMKVV